jgi:8-oxo-dGTP pyrophosphatase MutT (NUDIX family)
MTSLVLLQAKFLFQKFKLYDMNSVQRALWYYKDTMKGESKMTTRKFLHAMYKLIPHHLQWVGEASKIDSIVHRFMNYQNRLPRCGVILLCQNKVLVLRSLYGRNLMFPMGKQLRNESSHKCAERECVEETGLQVYLGEHSERVELKMNGHTPRYLYIYKLECNINLLRISPQTHYEVSNYRWVDWEWFNEDKPFRGFTGQGWKWLIHYLHHRIYPPLLLTHVPPVL